MAHANKYGTALLSEAVPSRWRAGTLGVAHIALLQNAGPPDVLLGLTVAWAAYAYQWLDARASTTAACDTQSAASGCGGILPLVVPLLAALAKAALVLALLAACLAVFDVLVMDTVLGPSGRAHGAVPPHYMASVRPVAVALLDVSLLLKLGVALSMTSAVAFAAGWLLTPRNRAASPQQRRLVVRITYAFNIVAITVALAVHGVQRAAELA